MTLSDAHDIFVQCPGDDVALHDVIFRKNAELAHQLSDGHIAHCEHPECHAEVVLDSLCELVCLSLLLAVYRQAVLSAPSERLLAVADWALGLMDSWLGPDDLTWQAVSDMCIVYYKTQSFLDESLRLRLRERSIWFGRSLRAGEPTPLSSLYTKGRETFNLVRKDPEYRIVRALFQAHNESRLRRKVTWLLGAATGLAAGAAGLASEGGLSRVGAFIRDRRSMDASFREATLEVVVRELAYIKATNWRGLGSAAARLNEQIGSAEGL